MYINTETSSLARLPVCDSVRTGLTSYSTSRCLSSLLLFSSGSGSVDLKNRRRTRGQPCGLGHRSCCIPLLGVQYFSLQCLPLSVVGTERQNLGTSEPLMYDQVIGFVATSSGVAVCFRYNSEVRNHFENCNYTQAKQNKTKKHKKRRLWIFFRLNVLGTHTLSKQT